MSAAAVPSDATAPTFSPKVVLGMVFTALFAFAAFAVLSTYASDLRVGDDGGTHALSRSAVGFAGAVVLLRADGVPVLISRAPKLDRTSASLVVLTPPPGIDADELDRLSTDDVTLVVLPKWVTVADPLHAGWVRKAGLLSGMGPPPTKLFAKVSKSTDTAARKGVSRPVLSLAPGVSASTPGGRAITGPFRPGPIDSLQTMSGDGWAPLVVDEAGRIVVAASKARPNLFVLADPDLLNTQGLANLDTARASVEIVEVLRSDTRGVVFDVTMAGYGRSRSLGKLLLEPPVVGATVCAIAAALLMGLHALARFGPTAPAARAFSLGSGGLVDSTAGLIRMGKKEAELARPYAELVREQAARAVGAARGDAAKRLDQLERSRAVTWSHDELAAATSAVKTPTDLLAVARRWRTWKLEMTRERG